MVELSAGFAGGYWNVVVRGWKWIVAMALLGAAVAAGLSLTVKPTFEATAIIAMAPATLSVPTANQVPPYYLLVDSPRQLPIAFTPAYYVAVLKSKEVVDAVGASDTVSIAPGSSDKSLIEITARGDDAARVASTANKWALVGADRLQKLLVPSGNETLEAQKQLDKAEQDLVDFSRDNGLEYDMTLLRGSNSLPTSKKVELARLIRARDVAESVYTDLARDLERATLLAKGAYKPTVISAPQPTAPTAPRLIPNSAAGAALGLLIGILGALLLEYGSQVAKR